MKTTVLDYLEDTAKKFNNKIAFSDINSSVTWEVFVTNSKKYSTVLSKYFESGKAIGFITDKNIQTLELFFGALYSGCFYTFIDSTFPKSRIESMISTLELQYVVIDRKYERVIKDIKINPIYTDDFENQIEEYNDFRRNNIIDTDLVYANFTSGSTGTPKAVAVNHRCVIDFISCFTETFDIEADENIANQAPFDFDVSIKDIFSAVFTGATVHLVPKMYFSMPAKLIDFLIEREITTIIWAVSAVCIISTLNGFTYKVPEKLRKIMFSGEVMPVKHLHIWQKYLPAAEYINLYGPTEITCNCTYYKIDKEIKESESIPIGIPFKNERIILISDDDELITEEDVVGELCVSGSCVASGYYNNSEKTASAFIQNPLQNSFFERIYRTGDLAKLGKDGLLYYVGRKDFQIKHMGHRIELGEIEGAINSIQGITRVCCIFSNNKITAFYTGEQKEKKEIVVFLKSAVPVYMIPSDFCYMDSFILTKNGKIDRKVLQEKIDEQK